MFDSELAERLERLDRLTAEVAAGVGEFERSGGWAVEGAPSVVAWLRAQGMAPADAFRLARLGRLLTRLPALSAAWSSGELSGGQVHAVVARVPERRVALFAEHEAVVVRALAGLDVPDTARVMAEWSAMADALDGGGRAGTRTGRGARCGCRARWAGASPWTATSTPRAAPCWSGRWPWPAPRTTASPRRGGGGTRWSM